MLGRKAYKQNYHRLLQDNQLIRLSPLWCPSSLLEDRCFFPQAALKSCMGRTHSPSLFSPQPLMYWNSVNESIIKLRYQLRTIFHVVLGSHVLHFLPNPSSWQDIQACWFAFGSQVCVQISIVPCCWTPHSLVLAVFILWSILACYYAEQIHETLGEHLSRRELVSVLTKTLVSLER